MSAESARGQAFDSAKRPLTIVVAMLANIVIAAAKFITAAVSGSAALFAEGVHSVVDTANQGLLLIGARNSQRPADSGHPFGYGQDIYFWTLVYSVLLFGIGGGVSIYKGIASLQRPEPPEALGYSYAVLAVAFVAEGASWVYALWTVHRKEKGARFVDKLMMTKDPSRFVVAAEDAAALVGVSIAAAGIALTQVSGSPLPDAIASILIGVLLCGTALLITGRTRQLLIGQAASPEVVREIERLTEQADGISYAGPPLTLHLGPHKAVAAINVKFDPSLSSADVARCVDRLEHDIRAKFPEFERIFVEAQLATRDVTREDPGAGNPER